MAGTNTEPQSMEEQQQQDRPEIAKRKPDLDCIEEGEDGRGNKQLKPETPADRSPPPSPRSEEHEIEGDDDEDEGLDLNGNATVDKGKGVATAVDKGKGKMVVEDDDDDDDDDDDEDDDDDDDSDDDSSDDDGDVIGEADDESDFSDNPLAEVDLSNILPARTRRQAPPQPGAYLITEQDGDDDDKDSE